MKAGQKSFRHISSAIPKTGASVRMNPCGSFSNGCRTITPRIREAALADPVYREMAERFRAVNKSVSSWDGEALAELVPALEDLAEHAASLTEAFACLPEQYQDNLVSVADLVFVSRSLERIAEGLQKVAAEGLYAAS